MAIIAAEVARPVDLQSLLAESTQTEATPVSPRRSLRCRCTALSSRAWRMSHPGVPCDGTICNPPTDYLES